MSEKKTTGKKTGDASFTAEEMAAMKERAAEIKAAKKRGQKGDEEATVLAKIAEFEESDRKIAERLHALIKATAPQLSPRLWYGMPAYSRDGKVVFFFQGAAKFGTRYSTLGFSDSATLDEGLFWPTAYAVKELTPAVEEKIRVLILKAIA